MRRAAVQPPIRGNRALCIAVTDRRQGRRRGCRAVAAVGIRRDGAEQTQV